MLYHIKLEIVTEMLNNIVGIYSTKILKEKSRGFPDESYIKVFEYKKNELLEILHESSNFSTMEQLEKLEEEYSEHYKDLISNEKITMYEYLDLKGFINSRNDLQWDYVWTKGKFRVLFDTGSQADLQIQNYNGDWIHLHGIVGLVCVEFPHLGLRKVFELYNL